MPQKVQTKQLYKTLEIAGKTLVILAHDKGGLGDIFVSYTGPGGEVTHECEVFASREYTIEDWLVALMKCVIKIAEKRFGNSPSYPAFISEVTNKISPELFAGEWQIITQLTAD